MTYPRSYSPLPSILQLEIQKANLKDLSFLRTWRIKLLKVGGSVLKWYPSIYPFFFHVGTTKWIFVAKKAKDVFSFGKLWVIERKLTSYMYCKDNK